MLGKSTHLQVIPQQSTQMQQTCGYRHTTKTSRIFFNNAARAPTLALATIFKIQVSLQKFPFQLRTIVPWFYYINNIDSVILTKILVIYCIYLYLVMLLTHTDEEVGFPTAAFNLRCLYIDCHRQPQSLLLQSPDPPHHPLLLIPYWRLN